MRYVFFFLALALDAQLIPPGQPIPKTDALPVVFLNGFELNCAGASFSGNFGIADQVLQSSGRVSVFFNYCNASGSTIEDLGDAFGTFLNGLRYTTGQPVDQVDCVAFSMGGLILRSYLSGKRTAAGMFNPPNPIRVRKAIFIATPHFGSGIPILLPFSNGILDELSSGSRFLFDLATWNQNGEDLRGVDAIAAIGNGGTGRATTNGFDDGVVALTSASLGFYAPGRTRVFPYCHVAGGGLISAAGYCSSNANGIARIDSADHPVARLIVSFLSGTNDWQNVGTAAEQDPLLSQNGGLAVLMRDANDVDAVADGIVASGAAQSKSLNVAETAYTDMFRSGGVTLDGIAHVFRASSQVTLPATVYLATILKPGPAISGIAPAASRVFPLGAAAGELISIYGNGLDNATVSANGIAMQIVSASSTLINAILPDLPLGLQTLTVQNSGGMSSVRVLIDHAVPAVFTLDQSGSGAAAAIDASTGTVVDSTHRIRAGDYVALFLTGLGATTRVNGLDIAKQQPLVTIGGENCSVTYAGRVPGIAGLDQINCIVPQKTGTQPVVVVSGTRRSNVTTLTIE